MGYSYTSAHTFVTALTTSQSNCLFLTLSINSELLKPRGTSIISRITLLPLGYLFTDIILVPKSQSLKHNYLNLGDQLFLVPSPHMTQLSTLSPVLQIFSIIKYSFIKSCSNLCDPMDCSLPDSSANGIFQARILEWVVIPSSRESSRHKDGLFLHWNGRMF